MGLGLTRAPGLGFRIWSVAAGFGFKVQVLGCNL